ncbi:MAG: hypothetical protein HYT27_02125 [Parcubacteria group bacterium]|nr:hypothetical protein [Parcubacteria group bacterium]
MKLKLVSLIAGIAIVSGLIGFVGSAEAATRVRGYYKPSTGRYIMPHYRTSPNSTRFDNYSTKGNYNLYTGEKGYTSPYKFKSYKFKW